MGCLKESRELLEESEVLPQCRILKEIKGFLEKSEECLEESRGFLEENAL